MANSIDFDEAMARALKIRARYHELEQQHHGSDWTIEEDALAFLSDAGLVGRLTMAQQGRWPKGADSKAELAHKLGECMWWLMVLADRMDMDSPSLLADFLGKTEKLLEK